jgi:N-acetylmuramoyl-L-alanine amidase
VSGIWRGRLWRTAVAILLAILWPVLSLDAGAAAAPRPAPSAPKLAPIGLHSWGKTVGAEVSWVEKGKKLRLKNAFHAVIFELGRREITVDGVRVFLGDAPLPGRRTLMISPVDRDHLLLPLLAPHQLPSRGAIRTVVLDAGHGGKDKGKTNDQLKIHEKDLTLDLIKRLKPLLEDRGYKVVFTREDDTFIELGDRPARAATAGADLFLAIHFNAGPPAVTGIETYTLTPQYQRSTASDKFDADDNVAAAGNAWDGWNALLGYSIQQQMLDGMKCFDRGLKRARFVVIRDLAPCPGVLIECGFLSNSGEAKLIATPAHRQRLAGAIAAGVDAFAAHLGTSDTTPRESPAANPAPSASHGGGGAIRAPRPNTAKPTAPQ